MAASLNDLVADFRIKVNELLQRCDGGAQMVLNESVRSPLQQAAYWRQSRSISEINQAIAMLRSQGAS
jgi:hypothetical protein